MTLDGDPLQAMPGGSYPNIEALDVCEHFIETRHSIVYNEGVTKTKEGAYS